MNWVQLQFTTKHVDTTDLPVFFSLPGGTPSTSHVLDSVVWEAMAVQFMEALRLRKLREIKVTFFGMVSSRDPNSKVKWKVTSDSDVWE